jgi:hypothetical protein
VADTGLKIKTADGVVLRALRIGVAEFRWPVIPAGWPADDWIAGLAQRLQGTDARHKYTFLYGDPATGAWDGTVRRGYVGWVLTGTTPRTTYEFKFFSSGRGGKPLSADAGRIIRIHAAPGVRGPARVLAMHPPFGTCPHCGRRFVLNNWHGVDQNVADCCGELCHQDREAGRRPDALRTFLAGHGCVLDELFGRNGGLIPAARREGALGIIAADAAAKGLGKVYAGLMFLMGTQCRPKGGWWESLKAGEGVTPNTIKIPQLLLNRFTHGRCKTLRSGSRVGVWFFTGFDAAVGFLQAYAAMPASVTSAWDAG